jgi:hypothetical protein
MPAHRRFGSGVEDRPGELPEPQLAVGKKRNVHFHGLANGRLAGWDERHASNQSCLQRPARSGAQVGPPYGSTTVEAVHKMRTEGQKGFADVR